MANHLANLTSSSAILFNFALLITSVLVGKIITNFAIGKPGVAGIRVTEEGNQK